MRACLYNPIVNSSVCVYNTIIRVCWLWSYRQFQGWQSDRFRRESKTHLLWFLYFVAPPSLLPLLVFFFRFYHCSIDWIFCLLIFVHILSPPNSRASPVSPAGCCVVFSAGRLLHVTAAPQLPTAHWVNELWAKRRKESAALVHPRATTLSSGLTFSPIHCWPSRNGGVCTRFQAIKESWKS